MLKNMAAPSNQLFPETCNHATNKKKMVDITANLNESPTAVLAAEVYGMSCRNSTAAAPFKKKAQPLNKLHLARML